MNDDDRLITAALTRRFARAASPECPAAAWHATPVGPPAAQRSSVRARFAYGAALLGVVAVASLAAQASSTVQQGYLRIVQPLFSSSKPLMPLIHRADRLTIAEAQQRIPFPIVALKGLPPGSEFRYAHVVSEKPVPRVALEYQAHVGSRYYRISVNETTVASGPPVTRFEFRSVGHPTKVWNVPIRRWKHGNVVMELLPVLPAAMTDRIVRANTL
jgi:hypothetical protein